jgi:hypothetical protein
MSIIDPIYAKLKAASPEMAREVLDFVEFLESKTKSTVASAASWDEVRAALPGHSGFIGDPVDIQRELRAEWDNS